MSKTEVESLREQVKNLTDYIVKLEVRVSRWKYRYDLLDHKHFEQSEELERLKEKVKDYGIREDFNVLLQDNNQLLRKQLAAKDKPETKAQSLRCENDQAN